MVCLRALCFKQIGKTRKQGWPSATLGRGKLIQLHAISGGNYSSSKQITPRSKALSLVFACSSQAINPKATAMHTTVQGFILQDNVECKRPLAPLNLNKLRQNDRKYEIKN